MLPGTYESPRGGEVTSYLGFEYSLRREVSYVKSSTVVGSFFSSSARRPCIRRRGQRRNRKRASALTQLREPGLKWLASWRQSWRKTSEWISRKLAPSSVPAWPALWAALSADPPSGKPFGEPSGKPIQAESAKEGVAGENHSANQAESRSPNQPRPTRWISRPLKLTPTRRRETCCDRENCCDRRPRHALPPLVGKVVRGRDLPSARQRSFPSCTRSARMSGRTTLPSYT